MSDFRECKVRVKSSEVKKVQQCLFNIGYKWSGNRTYILSLTGYGDYINFHINGDKKVTWSCSEHDFKNSSFKEISWDGEKLVKPILYKPYWVNVENKSNIELDNLLKELEKQCFVKQSCRLLGIDKYYFIVINDRGEFYAEPLPNRKTPDNVPELVVTIETVYKFEEKILSPFEKFFKEAKEFLPDLDENTAKYFYNQLNNEQ